MDEVKNQCHTSEVLRLQGTLFGVYSSFNYSSQTLREGLLPGLSLLLSINTCKKMDYEAVKAFICGVK